MREEQRAAGSASAGLRLFCTAPCLPPPPSPPHPPPLVPVCPDGGFLMRSGGGPRGPTPEWRLLSHWRFRARGGRPLRPRLRLCRWGPSVAVPGCGGAERSGVAAPPTWRPATLSGVTRMWGRHVALWSRPKAAAHSGGTRMGGVGGNGALCSRLQDGGPLPLVAVPRCGGSGVQFARPEADSSGDFNGGTRIKVGGAPWLLF